ncbi:hypothetical protein FF38_00336 [Lucilia cuprina]|uniref:Uncharacterized protein n=1 Tax=Lucilia cuprina TaxID=7375 RepID=A0A0L0CAL4_LUCCU|nr:hypothetical protein FF38_00336 [Lucilia cuprina]
MQHQYKQKHQQQYTCNNKNNNEHQSHKRIEKRRTTTKAITEQNLKTIPKTTATTMSTPKYASANVQQQELPRSITTTTIAATSAVEATTIRTKPYKENALKKQHSRHKNTNNTTAITTDSNMRSISNMSSNRQSDKTAFSSFATKRSISWSYNSYPAGQLVQWIFLTLLIYLSMGKLKNIINL